MNMRLRIVGVLATASTLIMATPATAASGVSDFDREVIQGEVDTASSASRTTTGSQLERPEWTNTPCPEITDSITRLYTAFFQRQPEESGFDFWTNAYASGGWNLDKMARQFVVSDEFVDTYGSLTNGQFIDLIYQNVQGRAGDPAGRAYWLEQLDSGQMTRGRVMIFFSESEEYVTNSGTVRPMAGYLGWYPAGTTWACARGAGAVELPANPGFTDVLVTNFERSDQRYTLVSYDRSFQSPIVLVDETLPSDFYNYYRAREFGAGDGYVEFDMAGEMYWVVVNYPTAMVEPRPGWDSDEAAAPAGPTVPTPAAPTPAAPTPAAPTEPEPTASQSNAIESAEAYLRVLEFSRSGLIDQLEFEGFSNADATFAVDYLAIDFDAQATKKAASYLEVLPFSRSGLIDQLEFDGFTQAQAVHGTDALGTDYNFQAERKAASYLEVLSFSCGGLIDQLRFDGFTAGQANHGANSTGLCG